MTSTVFPERNQSLQDVEQLVNVGEMQAGGGLVEDVDGPAGGTFRQFFGEFDALCFAAGKRRCRLAQLDVTEPHVEQCLQLLIYLRNVFEQRQRFLDGRVQQVGDRLSFVLHRQRLAVVARAATHVTQHVNIGKKVHLDALHAVAFARFATSTFDVEREAPRFVTTFARLGQHRVELAQRREQTRVSRGIRSRRASDGRLIDLDHLVDVFQSFDRFVWSRFSSTSHRDAARARSKECLRRASIYPNRKHR